MDGIQKDLSDRSRDWVVKTISKITLHFGIHTLLKGAFFDVQEVTWLDCRWVVHEVSVWV